MALNLIKELLMNKTPVNTVFKLTWLLIASLILSNCTRDQHSKIKDLKKNPPSTSPGTSLPPGSTNEMGTTDSGGGNGIENKVYEKYIIDPTQLPAFEKHLKEKFVSLDEKSKNNDPDNDEESLSILNYFKMKTWYLAPVKLKSLSKTAIGISFSQDETQQLAIQNEAEIWIDKNAFDKMNSEEQSLLILHEFTMTLYLLKYYSMSNLCKKLNFSSKKEQDCSTYKSFDDLLPAVDPSPLESQDYQRIRKMTNWLDKNSITSPLLETIEQFSAQEFDQRIFNPQNYKANSLGKEEELTFKYEDILAIIERTKALGKMPRHCKNADTKKIVTCDLSMIETSIKLDTATGFDLPGMIMSLKGDVNFNGGSYLFKSSSYYGTYTFDPYSKEQFLMVPLSPTMITNAKIGDPSELNLLILKKISNHDKSYLILDAVVSVSGIVVEVKKNGENIECLTDTKETSEQGTGKYIFAEGENRFYEFLAKNMKPAAACH